MSATSNNYLRHTLATIAYRFQKTMHQAAADFGDLNISHGTRTPLEIVNHMYHVLHATKSFIQQGIYNANRPEMLSMDQEIARFNAVMAELDAVLAAKEIDSNFANRLLQGPLADILTHIGQLSMLSRLHHNPISGEDFSAAPIKIGQLIYF